MEQQPIVLNDALQKDFARIENKLKNNNYPAEFAPMILEKLGAGQTDFVVRGTEPVEQVPEKMMISLVIGKVNSNVYLQAVETELTLTPYIPNVNIKDGGKVILNTLDIDDKITKAYAKGIMFPGQDAEREVKLTEFTNSLSKDMQLLMKEQPDIFNQIVVKHNPPLNFDIPTELQQQQARIIDGNYIQNTFSSYYNLSPIEMYGMLKNDLPVLKKLFEEGVAVNKWIRLTNDRDEQGRLKIKSVKTGDDISIRTPLSKYNFVELRNKTGLDQVARTLEKGNLHMVTNGNEKGHPYVLIGAKPGYQMEIVMYTLDRAPIYYQNDYLKNPLKKTAGEVSSLPTETQQNRYGSGFVEAQRRNTMKPKEHIIGTATPAEEVAPKKRNSGRQQKDDTAQDSKKKRRR